jgi:hypothetical protein
MDDQSVANTPINVAVARSFAAQKAKSLCVVMCADSVSNASRSRHSKEQGNIP